VAVTFAGLSTAVTDDWELRERGHFVECERRDELAHLDARPR
jgi:hypothetical protein